jgi:hypothetical protein
MLLANPLSNGPARNGVDGTKPLLALPPLSHLAMALIVVAADELSERERRWREAQRRRRRREPETARARF